MWEASKKRGLVKSEVAHIHATDMEDKWREDERFGALSSEMKLMDEASDVCMYCMYLAWKTNGGKMSDLARFYRGETDA